MQRLFVLMAILSVSLVTAIAGQVNAAECPDCPATKPAVAGDSSKQAELERQSRQERAKALQQQRQVDRKIAREEAERMEEFRRTHPGSAILHLDVPTGAMVTVERIPSCECCPRPTTHSTHNRSWQRYRHVLIDGIKPGTEIKVVVRVSLRTDRCEFKAASSAGSEADDATACDCEYDLRTCCKTVRLRAGDDEYLNFLSTKRPVPQEAIRFVPQGGVAPQRVGAVRAPGLSAPPPQRTRPVDVTVEIPSEVGPPQTLRFRLDAEDPAAKK